ncbi:HNH endonuclease family protein [Actinospongicola halichondriae]|uniref:HNH endonuclease family protein n=1 Tax=Actinospongicola halichondriae TaxID=3236844 RepID=UPI003D5A2D99
MENARGGRGVWRRRSLVMAGIVGVGLVGAIGTMDESSVELESSATTIDVTTTTERQSTTTERQTTTTTRPPALEGGYRSGEFELASATTATTIVDRVDRAVVVFEDLALLDSLTVADESHASTYDRGLFPHWDDEDHDGCDTRCEVLTSQMQADGSWFSEWDGATESDTSLVHIDHVVALAEAWRSGAHGWTASQRDEFADDRTNLLAVTEASNLRKSDKDAASWFPSRAEANCLWARTTVVVKDKWELSVDAAEKDALANLLRSCGAVPPTTTTTAPPPPPTTTYVAPRPIVPQTTQPPANNCTPGYSPCLPPAEDYDCAGGSGNGPAYTGRVNVDHSYGDPYDLDRDGDGVGCD